MNTLIELLKAHPIPVLITSVAVIAMIVPLAVAGTWWLGRKLKGIEDTQHYHHVQLNDRIDDLSAQHNELRATINTRFDDFRQFIVTMFEREDPKKAAWRT